MRRPHIRRRKERAHLGVIEEPGVEVGFRGLPVGLDDGGFSVGNLLGRGWRGGSLRWRTRQLEEFRWAGFELGLGEAAKRRKKKNEYVTDETRIPHLQFNGCREWPDAMGSTGRDEWHRVENF